MEEVKNKKNSKSKSKSSSVSNTSKTKKKTKKQIERMQIDNDLLFDEIMKKKQVRQEKRRLRELSRQEKMNLSSDELLDMILEQKKAKNVKKAKKPIVVDKENVVSEIVQDIVKNEENVTLSDDSVEIQLEETVDIKEDFSYDFEQKEKVGNKYSVLKLIISFSFILIIGIIFGINFSSVLKKDVDVTNSLQNVVSIPQIELKIDDLDNSLEIYNDCLMDETILVEPTDTINNYIQDMDDYFSKKYRVSVKYEDLISGFTYSYNEENKYYAASTIKALVALYVYTKAESGEIDLDDTITYSSKYKYGSSKGMAKHRFGDKVTLRELVYHSVSVSDNSAHQMLMDYIGFNKLKSFGKSLGATNTLVGGDNFGSISANDGVIYMKSLYDFLESSTLGSELKSYFVTAEQNGLSIVDENILAAHKYGEYDMDYHDIGIVYDEVPYAVAILTKEGYKSNFVGIVQDVNKKVYGLHRLYNDAKKEICKAKVYTN